MATMQGITGKLSGKMGSAVFRVRDGQQVVTQYNPIVKNPNTSGQQSQRAAFKLMSQLAAIMSPGFGTMSVAKRKAKGGTPSQRNAFTQINFPLVEISTEDKEVKATIPMEQIKLTSSFRPLGNIALSSESPTEVDATIENIPTEVSTVRIILIRYPKSELGSQAQLSQMVDVPVDTEHTAAYTFNGLSTNGEKVTVLAFGLIPSESAKTSIDIDNIHTPDDEDFISAVKLNAMVADGTMSTTVTIGANTVTVQ